MLKLKTIEEVMDEIRQERGDRHDVILNNSRDLRIEYPDADRGYQVLLEGRSYPLGPVGQTTICRLLRMDKGYFDRYPQPSEFIEHVKTLLPIRCPDGILLRLNGEAKAVLPRGYRILDDDQALDLMSEMVRRHLPSIRGVTATSSRWDRSVYRILFGDSVLKKDEIFPVVNFTNSEAGLAPLSLDAGTFRLVCLNGSMHPVGRGQRFRWGHDGDFQEKMDDLAGFLRRQAQVAQITADALQYAAKATVPSGPEEIRRLNRARWISRGFAREAEKVLETKGRVSKYAVFNALTNAAQALRLPERLKIESVAHAYLLSR